MTAYRNFVQDFPQRCRDLLNTFEEQARDDRLDVTLLLSLAMPSLIIPFERLSATNHPSQDATRFEDARKVLAVEMNNTCCESTLWPFGTDNAWRFKKLTTLNGDPDGWGLDTDTKPIANKQVNTVVTILRNALAHGNIWTTGNPIKYLVFVSLANSEQPRGPFKTLQCSPEALTTLVRNWVDFLSALNIPGNAFVETSHFEDHAA